MTIMMKFSIAMVWLQKIAAIWSLDNNTFLSLDNNTFKSLDNSTHCTIKETNEMSLWLSTLKHSRKTLCRFLLPKSRVGFVPTLLTRFCNYFVPCWYSQMMTMTGMESRMPRTTVRKERERKVLQGYMRCDYFIVTYCIFVCNIIWWLLILKIAHICRSKITQDGLMDGPTDRPTNGPTDQHNLF